MMYSNIGLCFRWTLPLRFKKKQPLIRWQTDQRTTLLSTDNGSCAQLWILRVIASPFSDPTPIPGPLYPVVYRSLPVYETHSSRGQKLLLEFSVRSPTYVNKSTIIFYLVLISWLEAVFWYNIFTSMYVYSMNNITIKYSLFLTYKTLYRLLYMIYYS